MVEYRLSVIKLSDGGYLVNHYHKSPDWHVPDLDSVIIHMTRLHQSRPSALHQEPTLIRLDDNDYKRVMDVRGRLLKENLGSRV